MIEIISEQLAPKPDLGPWKPWKNGPIFRMIRENADNSDEVALVLRRKYPPGGGVSWKIRMFTPDGEEHFLGYKGDLQGAQETADAAWDLWNPSL